MHFQKDLFCIDIKIFRKLIRVCHCHFVLNCVNLETFAINMQVSSLNDLLACDKAVPASPLSWEVTEELADLFLIYLKSDPAPEKLSRLQYLLNINDATAEALQGMKDRAPPTSGSSEEEFVF